MKKDAVTSIRRFLSRFVWLLPSPKEGKIKAIVLSLLVATTFWFFNALNKSDYTTRIDYPVVFDYNKDSTYLLSSLPENITLEISGGGWNLLRKTLFFDRPPVEISLDAPTETKYIDSRSIAGLVENRLGDVRLNYIVTDTLFLNIDKAASKEVFVMIDTTKLRLANPYRLVSAVQIVPEQVELRGPASMISHMEDTLYVQLPEENIREDFSEKLPLAVNQAEHLQILPDNVQIDFKVAPFSLFKKNIALTALNFPKDSSVYLDQESVAISFWLQNNYVELANNYDFELVANLQNMHERDSTITPVLKSYPEFAGNITITPSKVKVRYAE